MFLEYAIKEGINNILRNISKDKVISPLKCLLFLTAKYNYPEELKDVCQFLRDKIPNQDCNWENILHSEESEEGLYPKQPLSYCNDNSMLSGSVEILRLEREMFPEVKSGLQFFRQHLSPGPLIKWIFNTYPLLYFVQPKSFVSALLFVTFQLGVLSYLPAVLDMVSDISLYKEYSNFNRTLDIEINSSCTSSYFYKPDNLESTYNTASKTTFAVIIASVFGYCSTVILAESQTVFNSDKVNKRFLSLINTLVTLLFWPLVLIYQNIKLQRSNEKTLLKNSTEKCNTVWKAYKLYEQGTENTIQLFISLWALRHFMPCLIAMKSYDLLKTSFSGLTVIFHITNNEADIVSKTLGKVLWTIISLAMAMSMMKNDKQSYSPVEKIAKSVLLFIAYLSQIFTRLVAIFFLIFVNEDNSPLKYFRFIGLHWIATLAIVILFETSGPELYSKWQLMDKLGGKLKAAGTDILYIVIRTMSSMFFLPSVVDHTGVQYTFISQTIYLLLVLAENLFLVSIFHQKPESYPPEIVERWGSTNMRIVVLVGWTLTVILQVCNMYLFG